MGMGISGRQPSPRKRLYLGQRQAAYLLLVPFLAFYLAFMVYPFFHGIWISLHDWNLLAVAFNPDAKEFVGAKNYVRFLWGRNIQWSPWASPALQTLGLAGAVLSVYLHRTGRMSKVTAVAIAVTSVLFCILPGFHAGEGGRWGDRRFWPSVGHTIEFVALTVPAVTAISLVIAAATNRQTRAMAILRAVFFLSAVFSVTVVTLVWLMMFSPRQGIIANVFDMVGWERISWLTDTHLAMPAIVITTVWWSVGVSIILFLAGLQDISKEIYEAAALDNARGAKAFFHITLPNLKHTITLVVVLQIIAHFQVFGQSHLMTDGGPNDRTQVLVRHIYQTGFRDSELGRASAMAVFLFLIMGAFSLLQFIIGREKD